MAAVTAHYTDNPGHLARQRAEDMTSHTVAALAAGEHGPAAGGMGAEVGVSRRMATRAAAVAGAAGLMLGGSAAVLADTAPAAVVVHVGDHQQGKVSSLADYGDRVLAADYGDGVTAAVLG